MNVENIIQNKERGIYDIYIPSLERVYPFREVNLSQQKRLVKSIITGDEVYCTEFLYTLLNIITENSVENINLEKLDLHDILVIAIGMRANSIGYKMKLNVTCNKCQAIHTVSMNLQTIYDTLIKSNPVEHTIKINDLTFKCKLPGSQDEKKFLYDVKSAITRNEDLIEKFIILNIDRYVGAFSTINDKCKFYKNLPVDVFTQLLKTVESINNHIQDIVLFDIKCVKDCPAKLTKNLSYDVEYLYAFMKLIYSEDLMALYKDIYYLQKIGIEPEYAEGLTAPERQLMWNYFLADEDRKKKLKEQFMVR